MPRLGIPANINRVSARFKQPTQVLNPLGLQWGKIFDVVCDRPAIGAREFGAYWVDGNRLLPFELTKRPLIPLLVAVSNLFEYQIDTWRAYALDGSEQPLITGEILKQLSEYSRKRSKANKSPPAVAAVSLFD